MSDPFHQRGQALEDAFFGALDQKLLDQMRAKLAAQEASVSLAQLSGIQDQAILADLIQHGVTPENFAALALLPSVEIAWCDGTVTQDEQDAVLKAAVAQGLSPSGPGIEILKLWLQKKPTDAMKKAWSEYAAGLVKSLPADQLARIRGEIVAKAKAVATASGGFLGLGSKISAAEEKTLSQIEAALLP